MLRFRKLEDFLSNVSQKMIEEKFLSLYSLYSLHIASKILLLYYAMLLSATLLYSTLCYCTVLYCTVHYTKVE